MCAPAENCGSGWPPPVAEFEQMDAVGYSIVARHAQRHHLRLVGWWSLQTISGKSARGLQEKHNPRFSVRRDCCARPAADAEVIDGFSAMTAP